MKTKPIPAIVMLTAGFITCIVAIFQKMELLAFTKTLLLVLIIFYLLGGIAAYILEKNFKAAKDEESSTEEKADGDAEESADEKKEDTLLSSGSPALCKSAALRLQPHGRRTGYQVRILF